MVDNLTLILYFFIKYFTSKFIFKFNKLFDILSGVLSLRGRDDNFQDGVSKMVFGWLKQSSPSIMVTRNPDWSFQRFQISNWLRKRKVLVPLVRPARDKLHCFFFFVCYGMMMFLFLSTYYEGFATMNKLKFFRSRTWSRTVKCAQLSLKLLSG